MDEVSSYVGMRTVGTARDEAGHLRITLNGTPRFQLGPLDLLTLTRTLTLTLTLPPTRHAALPTGSP